jgi:hypothetical protein
MSGKEREIMTRELVEAGDKVAVYSQKWKAAPTAENYAAFLAARIGYLESEVALGIYLREKLEARVAALEARDAVRDAPIVVPAQTGASGGKAQKNRIKRKQR